MDPGSPGTVIALSIIVAEVLVAMFSIIFITSIILRDYCRKNKLEDKDKIHLALKASSIFFMTVLPYNEFSKVLKPDHSISSPLFTLMVVYCMCSSPWLITLQCFFYFIKVVNFQWVFICWAKMRISSIVSRQIVVVEVMSLSTSLLHLLPNRMAHVSNSSEISPTYMSPEPMIVNNFGSYLLLIIIYALHFLTTIATFITAAFLRCHVNKMKDTNTTGEVHRFGYWINIILVFSFISTINVLQILETPHLRTTWKEMISYFILCRKPDTQFSRICKPSHTLPLSTGQFCPMFYPRFQDVVLIRFLAQCRALFSLLLLHHQLHTPSIPLVQEDDLHELVAPSLSVRCCVIYHRCLIHQGHKCAD
ncbi:taste receptor type 2 member 4-like [Hyla sarda]|uniref:taste receptor type 2 member 4-like n=1 Tax=Hyla sarda TaxID=327740 RepID=UPI0024C453B7|nr:taste receptor type 2 member 4-like [Hyla sarda]